MNKLELAHELVELAFSLAEAMLAENEKRQDQSI